MPTPELKFTPEELAAYMHEVFPQTADLFTIKALAPMTATVSIRIDDSHLRPGGTVSGPTMFLLADCAFYMACLGVLGREALTVTTNCAINFMRKPEPKDMVAEARILKLGKTLAVGDALLTQEGQSGPICQASFTYSIPPRRARALGVDTKQR